MSESAKASVTNRERMERFDIFASSPSFKWGTKKRYVLSITTIARKTFKVNIMKDVFSRKKYKTMTELCRTKEKKMFFMMMREEKGKANRFIDKKL